MLRLVDGNAVDVFPSLRRPSKIMTEHSPRTGLLLVNLGTPTAPTVAAVRRYLREFLADPRVIDLPRLQRSLLLNLVILPFRPRRSAAAYVKVFDPERGSPLLFHSRDLTKKVGERLAPAKVQVDLAMRYGEPSIDAALDRFAEGHVERARRGPRGGLPPLSPIRRVDDRLDHRSSYARREPPLDRPKPRLRPALL